MDYKQIKKEIEIQMIRLELTQEDLAKEKGCTQQLISKVLNDPKKSKPTFDWIIQRLNLKVAA